MALVPSTLELELIAIFTEMKNAETPITDAQYANKMAQAITNYIKTATVTTTVSGGACAPGGPIAGGVGSGSLS